MKMANGVPAAAEVLELAEMSAALHHGVMG